MQTDNPVLDDDGVKKKDADSQCNEHSFGVFADNFHQAACVFLLDEEGERSSKFRRPEKWLFAGQSLGLVLFQVFAVLAIIWNTVRPSCVNNLHCDRTGTYCTATGGEHGRCEYCANAGAADGQLAIDRYLFGGLDEVNATSLCADERQYSADYCDHSTANAETCAHPACRACPGSTEDPNPGWGVPYRLAITRTGRGNTGHYPDIGWMENSTWGITLEHTVIRDNVAAMQYSDGAMLGLASTIVGLNLADEIRDIKLCEITINDRGGGKPWRPQDATEKALTAVVLLGFCAMLLNESFVKLWEGPLAMGLFVFHLLVVVPASLTLIDLRRGNSPWRIFLLATNVLRRFAVVPMLAAAVPFLVLYDSANAKDIALNTVGALFLLQVDNEAFAHALPDHIRKYVEHHGRAEVGKNEARVLNDVTTWTWIPQVAAMVFPVLAVKYLHDPAGSWMGTPFKVALFVPMFAMVPGIAAEAMAVGEDEIKEKAQKHLESAGPEYAGMKAPQLREELETRGLDYNGKKAELMERLADALDEELKAGKKKQKSVATASPAERVAVRVAVRVAERVAFGFSSAGCVVCAALVVMRIGSGEEFFWLLAATVCGLGTFLLLWHLDSLDTDDEGGGGRLENFYPGVGKCIWGSGVVFAALDFMRA
eukprot:COSAG06_NODE_477_length_15216_cov_133.572402_2_plen_653_part_00